MSLGSLKTVAVDASLTGTAVAWEGVPGEVITARLDTPASRISGAHRLIAVRDFVMERARYADVVLLEGYAYAAPNGAHQAGELGGVLRVSLTEQGIPWTTVTPQNRGKFATGKPLADKVLVASAIAARTGVEFANSDAADAYALYCMVRQAYGQSHPLEDKLPVANLEAMITVDWPLEVGEKPWRPLYAYKPKVRKAKKAAAA